MISDDTGRTLWTGAIRPGHMHDQTALKTEGIWDLFVQYPEVKAQVDAGYRGLAKDFPVQVTAPPIEARQGRRRRRHRRMRTGAQGQSSRRIPVEHANAEHKQWRARSSAGSDATSTTTRPTWPSPAWSPTILPCGNSPHQPTR